MMMPSPRRIALLDTFLCLGAVLGLAASLIPDYRHVESLEYVATDFKTLYASVALFAANRDPYSVAGLAAIFARDHVVEPSVWFGHMPVYPPVTLLLLSPLSLVSMAEAARIWFLLSTLSVVLLLALMLREARALALGWPWRLAITAFSVGSPPLAFALDIGNLSVVAACLAGSAWMISLPRDQSPRPGYFQWHIPLAAVFLATAICLKPHLAFWIALGIALACGARGRRITLVAFALAAAACLATALILGAQGRLPGTLRSYSAIVAAEQASGSMAPASRELLPIGAQITSLRSLVSFFVPGVLANVLSIVFVSVLAILLIWTARVLSRRAITTDESILVVAAFCALGMVATYHRAHDSICLLPLALWICVSLRRGLMAPVGVVVLILLGWFGLAPPGGALVLYRQAALSASLIVICLVGIALSGQKKAA